MVWVHEGEVGVVSSEQRRSPKKASRNMDSKVRLVWGEKGVGGLEERHA